MNEQNAINPYDETEVQSRSKFSVFLKFTAIVLAILLVLVLLLRFLTPWLYYRLYFGDRIKGEITVMIDGEPSTILQDTAVSSFQGMENAAKFRAVDNELYVSTRANAYGSYQFSFYVEELPEVPLCFNSYQFNWWNVTEFELRYNVDTQAQIVEYRVVHTELNETGTKSEPIVSEGSYPLEEYWTEVSVCSP